MLVIDARTLKPPLSGVGRYTLNLILGLHRASAHETLGRITVWVPPRLTLDPTLASSISFDFTEVPEAPLSLANQWNAPRRLRKQGATLLHTHDAVSPWVSPCKSIVTIHDLIPLLCVGQVPRSIKQRHPRLYRRWLQRQADHADAVVTVSQFSADDLQKHLGVPQTKLHVIHNAVELQASAQDTSQDAAVLATLGVQPPYLLYVGRRDPYKNLPLLVRCFADLIKNDKHAKTLPSNLQLVVAGPRDPRYPEAEDEAAQLGIADRVRFLGQCIDTQLAPLYRHAAALVMPSNYEGFGLPPVEAMLHRTPVIAAGVTCLPEVCGEAAVYFDITQPTTLVDAMQHVLTSSELCNRLRDAGTVQAKNYGIETFVRKHVAMYEKLLP